MREKREHPRVGVSIPVLCGPVHGEAFGAIMADVGLGGARIECSQLPEFGTELCIAAHLPGSAGPSRLPAIVRWTKAGSFGVQFGPLGARETRLIAELMTKAVRTA